MSDIVNYRLKKATNVIIVAFLCIIAFIVVTHKGVIDDVVLLEKRNPGYWNYLSQKNVQTLYTSYPDTNNLLISSLKSTTNNENYYGFSIKVNLDGSVRIDGVNYNDEVHIKYGVIQLRPGEYYFSDGVVATDGAYSYVYSGGDTLASLSKNPVNTFIADDQHIKKGFEVGIVISPGTEIHEIYRPMLRSVSSNTEYQPYMTTYPLTINESTIILYKNVIKQEISDRDLKLFENSISNDLDDCLWTSIIFSDYSGIQYSKTKTVTGSSDQFGRIY